MGLRGSLRSEFILSRPSLVVASVMFRWAELVVVVVGFGLGEGRECKGAKVC